MYVYAYVYVYVHVYLYMYVSVSGRQVRLRNCLERLAASRGAARDSVTAQAAVQKATMYIYIYIYVYM